MEENEKEITSPIKAIRAKCLDCCCGSANEVKLCTCTGCPLFAFRFGKNPFRKTKEMTDEEKAELAERLRLGRESKKETKVSC